MKIAYLFSRYPVISHTFCDTEMLALENLGVSIEVASIHPPWTSLRHEHAARLKAEIVYAPPAAVLKLLEKNAKSDKRWPGELVASHEKKYGVDFKPALRCRNALYFADRFAREGIGHVHVHFANRAAHTALFLKAMSGIRFSVTAHGQDFMTDLGSDELLREICHEAEFVAAETEFSKKLLAEKCPESVGKLVRVYNGMDLGNFPHAPPNETGNPPRILSVGRLIEFKGFHDLIAACAELKSRDISFVCEIGGEGPWRAKLEAQIDAAGVRDCVRLLGMLSQAQVFARMREADIFALACISDAAGATDVFPTVILEAMANARPIVSTRLAGVPEMVDQEKNGFLVEPGDIHGLADSLEKLLESPELRREFGNAARAKIENEFQSSHTVSRLKALFDEHANTPNEKSRDRVAATRFACLLAEWPAPEMPRLDRELLELKREFASMPIFVCKTPRNIPDNRETLQ
ncbi:MAG: glycosyltransferase, partial [Verrucomicrobiota bacterium]|nr:glycosyltransferase [Verrucomicrobiota bacterium]